jgi:hypothetical protein
MFAPKLDYLVVTTTHEMLFVVHVTRQKMCFFSSVQYNIIRKLRCHNHSDINWILKQFWCDCWAERRRSFLPSSRQTTKQTRNKGNLYLSFSIRLKGVQRGFSVIRQCYSRLWPHLWICALIHSIVTFWFWCVITPLYDPLNLNCAELNFANFNLPIGWVFFLWRDFQKF